MNIPIIDVRSGFEKNAGLIGGTLKAMFKHPKITLAIIGTGAAGLGALAVADKVHDAYNITSEMRKRKIMNDQSKILFDLLQSQKKLEPKSVIEKQQLKIQPLY